MANAGQPRGPHGPRFNDTAPDIVPDAEQAQLEAFLASLKWQRMVAVLFEEKSQYEALHALFKEQQELIVQRAADKLLRNVLAANRRLATIATVRLDREGCRRALAMTLGLPREINFTRLAVMLPPERRELLDGLIEETNRVLWRIHQWIRQNHQLLTSSLTLMTQLEVLSEPTAPNATPEKRVVNLREFALWTMLSCSHQLADVA